MDNRTFKKYRRYLTIGAIMLLIENCAVFVCRASALSVDETADMYLSISLVFFFYGLVLYLIWDYLPWSKNMKMEKRKGER